MKLIGHAAVFNSRSVDLGGFIETIAPGAFARTLRDRHPIFAVHHHDMADVLGATRSRTLKLSEDKYGLRFELTLPNSSLGKNIHESVRRGDIGSMSFSFHVNGARGESWRQTATGETERTLKDITLVEISTVALPAYPASTVSARASVSKHTAARKLTNHTAARNRMLKRVMMAQLQAA